ncbi:MAG TPA: hypothetical protein VIH53_06020, partial [Gemmatimonadaceae bacterium]
MIFHRVGSHTEGTKRRPSTAFFVSLGVHIVVAIAFMRMLILNADFSANAKRDAVREQRVGFVRLGNPGEKPTAGRAGGDGRPETPRAIHVDAPRTIPTNVPPPVLTVVKPKDEGGTGPLIGGGG